MSAEENAAFDAELARDDRKASLASVFYDHRLRRARFAPPRDVHGKVITEKFSRMDIYTRDRATCQICRGPIDLMVAAPDPAALSIDHIDNEGPHTQANCRLAHLFCNNDAQWATDFDPELAHARLQYKIAMNEKAGPGDRFPRRSPLTGEVVGREEWLRHVLAAKQAASAQSERTTAQTIARRLGAPLRALLRRE